MKKIQYIILLLLISSTVNAQYFAEAFRLAGNQINGTAHSQAMGNAIGAIGGDFTSLSINPAGLGVYQTSEFTFTPSFSRNSSEVSLDNHLFSDNKFKVDVDQLGYVSSFSLGESSSSIVRVNIGLGYNKLADFNKIALGEYNGSSASFLDGIVEYANTEALSNGYLNQVFDDVWYVDWNAKLAWDTYLIDPVTDNQGNEIDGQYVNILYEGEEVNQRKSWTSKGGITEYILAAGLNFNHNFYLGATLGIHDVYLSQSSSYSENFSDDSFTYTDNYKLYGEGYVFKLGAIYKPTQALRLGLALHTPTYYQLDEKSTLRMNSYLLESYEQEGTNLFGYDFYTPMKAILSGALVVGKNGMISADAEFVDYSSMRYRNGTGDDPMNDINSEISDAYNSVINLRVGGEIRVSNNLSFQGGYEIYPNPFKSNVTYNNGKLSDASSAISVGVGFSSNSFFFDAAYKHHLNETYINDIQPNYTNRSIDYTRDKLMMTFGFRF